MARIKRVVFGVLIALALCGCTCGLAGCTDAEAKTASDGGRFAFEAVEHPSYSVTVMVLVDTETGERWLYVQDTTYGSAAIDIEPLDGRGDGTVSDQH